jgi:hypothetical protein
MNALYGDESILFTQTAEGGFTERNERKQNGTWIGPQGPRNLLVSGALIFAGLGPWSMGVVTPELFHNPWAQRPFPISSWPLPYCVVDLAADRARREHGKTARELLDLPAQWPVPDTNAGE